MGRAVARSPVKSNRFWPVRCRQIVAGCKFSGLPQSAGRSHLQETPRSPSIHGERHSIHVTGAFGSEKSDHSGEFFGFPEAAGGNKFVPIGEHLLLRGAGAGCSHFSEIIEAIDPAELGPAIVHTLEGSVFVPYGPANDDSAAARTAGRFGRSSPISANSTAKSRM